MFTRDDLIEHLLTMRNGTDKTTPQQAYYEHAAAFYRDLLPDWSIGRGLREAIEKQNMEKTSG